jgi:hypothetical protein
MKLPKSPRPGTWPIFFFVPCLHLLIGPVRPLGAQCEGGPQVLPNSDPQVGSVQVYCTLLLSVVMFVDVAFQKVPDPVLSILKAYRYGIF